MAEYVAASTKENMIFAPCYGEIFSFIKQIFAGKIAFYAENSLLFKEFFSFDRGLFLEGKGDALALFPLADKLSALVAAGGEKVLRAARFFAACTRLPILCVATDGRQLGAWEKTGEVKLGEEGRKLPLAESKVVLDEDLLLPTMKKSVARLKLARLADFETRALKMLRVTSRAENGTQAVYRNTSFREILLRNKSLCEGEALGEAFTLSRLLEDDERAFAQLSALYVAFFKRGYARRDYFEDGEIRLALSGSPRRRKEEEIPTPPEYARRVLALERVRGRLLREIKSLRGEGCCRAAGDLTALKYLPETHGLGLTSVMRDFGLMEWEL